MQKKKKPAMRPMQVLERAYGAPKVEAEAPAPIAGPGFTPEDHADEWHQQALAYADKAAVSLGTIVTTFKSGKIPDADGFFPATAFFQVSGQLAASKGLPRIYFSGKPGARGWIIIPRQGPNPGFDVEQGSPQLIEEGVMAGLLGGPE